MSHPYLNVLQADVICIQWDLDAGLQQLLQIANGLINVDILLNQIWCCDGVLLNTESKTELENKYNCRAEACARLCNSNNQHLAYPSSRHACFSRSSISISIISSGSLLAILFYVEGSQAMRK